MASAVTGNMGQLSVHSSSYATGVMGEVSTLQTALARCDWQSAQATSIRLVNLGRRVVAQQVKQDRAFDPIPMTLRLVESLNSPDIQWQEEVKYHIARATRLFMELACMKSVLDGKKVYRETQETLRSSLDRLMDYSKNQPTLLYELKCTSEALKLMEETDTKGYLTTLFSAASDPSISSVITLIGLLPGLIAKKNKDWFSEALFLSWMGTSARENQELFLSLRATLQANLDNLEMAQTGVEFLADIVWNGTPQLQREALTGEIGLITLLNKQRPSRTLFNLMATMWPVRYRTIQILSTLTDHSDPLIAREANQALFARRLQENNSTVKELLATLKKNPAIREQWKQQFEESKEKVIEQNIQEQQEIAEQEARLTRLEQQLASSIRSQRLSSAEITLLEQSIEKEKRYVQELRLEAEAHKENVETLHTQFKKGVNQLLDDIFAAPTPQPTRDGPPSHLCCPLSLDLMTDPVSDPEGNTYERSYIVNWLKMHGTSPITRTPMNVNSLTPNRAIQSALEDYNKQGGSPVAPKSLSPSSSTKESYTDLLLLLLENSSVQSIPTLVTILEGQVELLMSQNTNRLTSQQEESYTWIQKLLVNGKASSIVSKKLHQIHGVTSPLPQMTPQTITTSSPPLVEKQKHHIVSDPNKNGEGVAKDLTETAKRYRDAADQGNAAAQFNLGLRYAKGEGVTKDLAEAAKWFRKSADQGHAVAQLNLGVCYQKGEGVTKDLAEAAKWYRKAADQGNAIAQRNLGMYYQKGEGVTKDLAEAAKWYRKAADQGHADAQRKLGLCCKNGEGVAKDFAEAVKWYRKAADQGHAVAQLNLGICYQKGEGVAKDLAEAAKWYRKAADQGNADAQCNLGWFYMHSSSRG